MRDPDLQTDLQSNLQEDPPPNLQVDLQKGLQADLQMDLQADLQVRVDLQPDLQFQTGLAATQNSPLVLFQAETSTEREKSRICIPPDQHTSMGGTCEQRRLSTGSRRLAQGPSCVIGELPIKSSARRKFGSAYHNLHVYKDLQPTQIYKTHHITGSTPTHLRNRVHYIPSDAYNNIQAMLSHPEHPAIPNGNPVTPSFCEKGTTPVRQVIANSSQGVTHPSVPVAVRTAQFQQ